MSVMFVQVDKMDPSLPNSMPMDLLDATEDSSLCLSVIDRLRLEREERTIARPCSIGTKQNRSKAIRKDRGKAGWLD